MRITVKYLKRRGACAEQVALFREHYPNGANVTVPTVRKALRLGLNVGWLVPEPLRAEYERQSAPLRAEYDRQHALLLAEYDRQRASLLVSFLRRDATI